MSGELGAGLVLNILFWSGALCALIFVAVWIAVEWFPGRARRNRDGGRKEDERPASSAPPAADEGAERYRKAS